MRGDHGDDQKFSSPGHTAMKKQEIREEEGGLHGDPIGYGGETGAESQVSTEGEGDKRRHILNFSKKSPHP